MLKSIRFSNLLLDFALSFFGFMVAAGWALQNRVYLTFFPGIFLKLDH